MTNPSNTFPHHFAMYRFLIDIGFGGKEWTLVDMDWSRGEQHESISAYSERPDWGHPIHMIHDRMEDGWTCTKLSYS